LSSSLSGEIGPSGRGASCAAARARRGAPGIPIAAPDNTASDCLRFMVFACGACRGPFRASLSPRNFAAPGSEFNAPEVVHVDGKAVSPSCRIHVRWYIRHSSCQALSGFASIGGASRKGEPRTSTPEVLATHSQRPRPHLSGMPSLCPSSGWVNSTRLIAGNHLVDWEWQPS
jgi:hypothetical protein